MINYTERITLLIDDLVKRVPASATSTRAACWCSPGSAAARRRRVCDLPLPESAAERAGLLLLARSRDRQLTRRSEWFVTKSPTVAHRHAAPIDYMISFALPRFCDQIARPLAQAGALSGRSRWIAKLDTVVHELYHIDPEQAGHPPDERADGTYSRELPRPAVLRGRGREMVQQYLATKPDPAVYDFLQHNFEELTARIRRRGRHDFRSVPVVSAALHRGRSTQQPELRRR